MIKAIIFDLDGTLLDTLTDLTNSVNFALEKNGFPLRSKEEIRSFVGSGVKVLMKRALPVSVSEAEREKCLGVFKSHYLEHMNDNTVPFDSALDCLLSIRKRGIKTAVVSNKLSEAVSALCSLHFGGTIDLPLGVSDESERKPNPLNVLRALENFGCNKNEVLYVGDSDIDLQTAKNAGVECVCVSWGFRSAEQLKKAGAKKIVDCFEELKEMTLF